MPKYYEVSRMSPDEVRPYLQCFEREYWTCSLPDSPPIMEFPPGQGPGKVSWRGDSTLREVVASNDGLIIPFQREVINEGVVEAAELDHGTVVKIVKEKVVVLDPKNGPDYGVFDMVKDGVEPDYVLRETPGYSAIDRWTPEEVVSYGQRAEWMVVAENLATRGSRRSLFPLAVDFDTSIDAGPYHDELNRVRATRAKVKAGQPEVELRVTLPIEPLGYERAIRAMICDPVIVPDTSGFIDWVHRH